ncbi:hypothetical protein ACTOI6_18925 (plasmid) [Komagataeibacter intermedius]|uniref:hypothetical protein n=1 Tax=Komagataeibacter intermedius TaxID=66229 RepID=UPI00403684AA
MKIRLCLICKIKSPLKSNYKGAFYYQACLLCFDKNKYSVRIVVWFVLIKGDKKMNNSIPQSNSTVIILKHGYRWVKLNSQEAKDLEYNVMKHYSNSVDFNGLKDHDHDIIFSLRDKYNIRHVSVNYNPVTKKINGIQARVNAEIFDIDSLEELFSMLEIKNRGEIDYAITKESKLYIFKDTIKQESEKGVKFKKVKIKCNYALAEDGSLFIGEERIKTIPDDVVLKDVIIKRCKNITEWNHKVTGHFNASYSGLTTIGSDAYFGSFVIILDCKGITEWNNKVEGTFYAKWSGLTTIGPNAEFGGDVDISGTPLSKSCGIEYAKTPEQKQNLKIKRT